MEKKNEVEWTGQAEHRTRKKFLAMKEVYMLIF